MIVKVTIKLVINILRSKKDSNDNILNDSNFIHFNDPNESWQNSEETLEFHDKPVEFENEKSNDTAQRFNQSFYTLDSPYTSIENKNIDCNRDTLDFYLNEIKQPPLSIELPPIITENSIITEINLDIQVENKPPNYINHVYLETDKDRLKISEMLQNTLIQNSVINDSNAPTVEEKAASNYFNQFAIKLFAKLTPSLSSIYNFSYSHVFCIINLN